MNLMIKLRIPYGREEWKETEGAKKRKEQRLAPTFVNLKSNTMKKIT